MGAAGKGLQVWALVVACSFSQTSDAQAEYTLDELSLQQEENTYTVISALTVRASAEKLRRVLSSPEALPTLNPRIETADVLEQRGGESSRVRLVSYRCVLFFCRRYEWTQIIRVDREGDIQVLIEPGSGFFREGEIWYHVHALSPESARVQVNARLEPAMSLPPLIGPALMRGLLADDVRTWAANIAAVAREL